MQTGTKVAIGLGLAAATAGTAAWAKVNYDDAAAGRNNDRNALINAGLWVATPLTGVGGLVARKLAPAAAPWLFGATALMGVNAFAGAATLEQGWEDAGIAYCNFGICNRTAVGQLDAPHVYVGDNPLGDSTVRHVEPGPREP